MTTVSGVARIAVDEAWRSDASFTIYDAPDGAAAFLVGESLMRERDVAAEDGRRACRAIESAQAHAAARPSDVREISVRRGGRGQSPGAGLDKRLRWRTGRSLARCHGLED